MPNREKQIPRYARDDNSAVGLEGMLIISGGIGECVGYAFKDLGDLQGRGDGCASGGEDGVHFGLREGQERLDNYRVELCAAALN